MTRSVTSAATNSSNAERPPCSWLKTTLDFGLWTLDRILSAEPFLGFVKLLPCLAAFAAGFHDDIEVVLKFFQVVRIIFEDSAEQLPGDMAALEFAIAEIGGVQRGR